MPYGPLTNMDVQAPLFEQRPQKVPMETCQVKGALSVWKAVPNGKTWDEVAGGAAPGGTLTKTGVEKEGAGKTDPTSTVAAAAAGTGVPARVRRVLKRM